MPHYTLTILKTNADWEYVLMLTSENQNGPRRQKPWGLDPGSAGKDHPPSLPDERELRDLDWW